MIIHLAGGHRPARLVDPGDFTAFHIAVSSQLAVGEFRAALSEVGATPDEESLEHYWIPIDWVRAQALLLEVGPEWARGFGSMLDYARGKGWLRAGTVRAHVDWRGAIAGAVEAGGDPLGSADFTAAFRGFPAGVAVLTADAGAGPVGLTATSVMSASAAPPVLAFSISEMSSSTPTIGAAETLVVHLLDAADVDTAILCATSGIDRFADRSRWGRLPTGEPYFPQVRHWLRVRPFARMTAGTATVIAALALQSGGSVREQESPLVYHARRWHRLGEVSTLIP